MWFLENGESLEVFFLCIFTIKGQIHYPMSNGRSGNHTFLTTAIVYTSANED